MLNTLTTGPFRIPFLLSGVAVCMTRIARRLARVSGLAGRWLGVRPLVAILLCLIAPLGFYAGWSLKISKPTPGVHDEFSYLLAADTFAHGRLTNPTHPMWRHFETIHVIQRPSYTSKYPPGQGLALALGQVIAKRPIAGAWLSSAAACAAIFWMLRGCMPGRWALLGAVIVGLHPEVLYWSQDFWGGSLALLGGTLVVGAAVRILKKPRVWNAILLGIGIAILANTRPFEGTLLVAPVLAWLGIAWLRKDAEQRAQWIKRILAPLGICIFCMAGWMGYYNWRVTGNPLRMPYMVHESQYAMAPVFLFQKPRQEPDYPFPEIRALHAGQEMERYTHGRAGIVGYAKEKFTSLANRFQEDTALALPLIVLPWTFWRDRRLRIALVLLAICGAGVVIETFIQSHYVAPQLGALVLLLAGSMRWLNCWQRRQRLGQVLLWSVLLISAFGYATAYAKMAHADPGDQQFKVPRQRIIEKLEQAPGDHLVLIRDLPNRDLTEWVDNRADIDHAKIVWAHDMGPSENAELLKYFANRHVWLLEVGQGPGPLEPYPVDQTMPTTMPNTSATERSP